MDWYIRDIVLFGRDGETRVVSLGPGVNIITGASQTGKSALIPIVDYCLGAGYEVPVGIIRDFTLWYAIRLQLPHEQIFVARKEPGRLANTMTMHLIAGRDVPIPSVDALSGNTERDAVVEELSRRLGMMQEPLSESRYDTSGYTQPPTVRNVAPFLFQPQNVIANKDTLFYKTDQERHRDHRQRLLRIFPYVLSAIDSDYFRLKDELDVAQRQLRQTERLLTERRSLASQGTSVAQSLWDRSVALGLVGSDGQQSKLADIGTLRERLTLLMREVGSRVADRPVIAADPSRAADLDQQSRGLRAELATLRQQLASAQELSHEAGRYTGTLRTQASRLRVIGLVQGQANTNACPVCDQPLDSHVDDIERLRLLNEGIQAELDGVTAANPALLEYITGLRQRIDERRSELAHVESMLAELYRAQGEALSADEAWAEQQRHLGAIQFYLDRAPAIQNDLPDLDRRVEEQRRRVTRLQAELDAFDVADRLDSALGVIARTMSTLGQGLNLERPDAALRLDIKRLTVIRDSPEGRPERLYEIGSGENWVGYHLCALFALHSFFIHRNSPVPSFLFLDQPSQIYFPEERVGPQVLATEDRTDWAAVETLYRMIFQTVRDLDQRLQVIILDHADLQDTDFQNAVRYRWRNESRLV